MAGQRCGWDENNLLYVLCAVAGKPRKPPSARLQRERASAVAVAREETRSVPFCNCFDFPTTFFSLSPMRRTQPLYRYTNNPTTLKPPRIPITRPSPHYTDTDLRQSRIVLCSLMYRTVLSHQIAASSRRLFTYPLVADLLIPVQVPAVCAPALLRCMPRTHKTVPVPSPSLDLPHTFRTYFLCTAFLRTSTCFAKPGSVRQGTLSKAIRTPGGQGLARDKE